MLKPVIIGVHGYNSNGEYIKTLAPYIEGQGYQYRPFIYGKKFITPIGNLIANRFRTGNVSSQLINFINLSQRPVILLCHSNGLLLSYLAQKYDDKVIGVISFNGALDKDTNFNCWVVNCYHDDDWILTRLAAGRPCHKWGDYGAHPQKKENVVDVPLAAYYDGFNPHSKFLNHLDRLIPDIFEYVSDLLWGDHLQGNKQP